MWLFLRVTIGHLLQRLTVYSVVSVGTAVVRRVTEGSMLNVASTDEIWQLFEISAQEILVAPFLVQFFLCLVSL